MSERSFLLTYFLALYAGIIQLPAFALSERLLSLMFPSSAFVGEITELVRLLALLSRDRLVFALEPALEFRETPRQGPKSG